MCMAIAEDKSESYQLTNRANTVAVITDGSAVLGLGNIGRIVAMRAQGLGLKVVAFDPHISRDAAAKLGVELVEFLDGWFCRGWNNVGGSDR